MHSLEQLQSGELKGVKRLKMSAGLSVFPPEVFQLADTLEILDLSGNALSSLPPDFGLLTKLKIAFFSDNRFSEYPRVLANCPRLEMVGFKANQITNIPPDALGPQLRWLILTNNLIGSIPASIGRCIRLQKCMLAGNRLKHLPIEMAQCKNIELLRISANLFEALPTWLLSMPKLSWLAFAGNPFSTKHLAIQQLPEISWDELDLKELLGEGASGMISRAVWHKQTPEEVAVKLFKGEVTSDGLPSDELDAIMAAGSHPNLVHVLGKLRQHPQQKQGLVLRLIPPSFSNLGMPPSFETCTRDCYAEGTVFSMEEVLHVAAGVASVCAHLHVRGLMHGDLYAHNILVDKDANALLGDFGASLAYDVSGEMASALQRLEVRAFGCLLEDLLNYLMAQDASTTKAHRMAWLKNECMQDEVMQRPSFNMISEFIADLRKI